MPHISVISPVYKAQNILTELVSRLVASLEHITNDYEIILVEDCGDDDSWSVISNLAIKNGNIRGIKLSRNFGQHYAITCGLEHAEADWIVVMDCDLQDRPEEIINLYHKAKEGFDIVLASRIDRNDKWLKRQFSKLFYRTLGYLTGSDQDETIANFGIYSKQCINAVVSMRESIRYFPTMIKWVGFQTTKISVEHNARPEGNSSYNIKKLFNLALDIILAFSDKPIRLTIKFGVLISSISLVLSFYYLYRWIMGEVEVLGYTSLILSVWLLSGFIISTLGVIGLYIGKIFEGVKQRPIYIIHKTTDD